MKKKIVQLCVAACLAMTTTVTAYAVPTNQDLQESKSSVADAEAKYNDAKTKSDALQQKVEEMNMVMSDLVIKQQEIQGNIDTTTAQIEDKKAEVEKKQKEYNNRMVKLYKSPAPSLVEIIFTSENLGDMVSKIEGLKTISDYEKQLLTDLEKEKEDLDNKVVELQNLKDEQQAKIDEQKVKQKEAEALSVEAKNEEERVRKILASEKDKLGRIQAEIDEQKAAVEAAKNEVQTITDNVVPSRGGSATANNILSIAYSKLGSTYVYGASGPNTFDCSGFVQWVFGRAGISMSRTTYTQVNQGSAVSKGALQPGDLVFFGSSASSPSHVGIYVGNNSYIHAPQTGDVVKISSLASRTNFVAARRII